MCLKWTEDNLNSAYTIHLTDFAKKKKIKASLKYSKQVFSKTDQRHVCNPNPSHFHISWNLTSLVSTYSLLELHTCSEHLATQKQHPELQIKNWQCSERAVLCNHTKHFMLHQLICLASDQELQYGVQTHANNIDTLNSRGDHAACVLHEIWEQTFIKTASGAYVWLPF